MTLNRPRFLQIGQKKLDIPIYFPSVSSVKTAINPLDYVLVLSALRIEQFLVSAFDVHYADEQTQATIKAKIADAMSRGANVLMDSGNYESFWKEKRNLWKQDNYHSILTQINTTFAFSFDEQSPPKNFSDHLKLICRRYDKDKAVNSQTPIIPIIHDNSENLPSLCVKVIEATDVPMIAIPERCLGKGIFSHAHHLAEIRKAINEIGHYVGIHLLGTGNPISIAIYTLAGADSYDGLEWCRTVVDHKTAKLFHFAHADFFLEQTEYGDMDIDFYPRTLAHNLSFYHSWMNKLSQSIHNDEGVQFCKINFPDRIFSTCADELRWTF